MSHAIRLAAATVLLSLSVAASAQVVDETVDTAPSAIKEQVALIPRTLKMMMTKYGELANEAR